MFAKSELLRLRVTRRGEPWHALVHSLIEGQDTRPLRHTVVLVKNLPHVKEWLSFTNKPSHFIVAYESGVAMSRAPG